MNLPSSLTNSGKGSKESDFYNFPIIRRTSSKGFDLSKDDIPMGSQIKGKKVDKIITETDDRGGIQLKEISSNPLDTCTSPEIESAPLNLLLKINDLTELGDSSRFYNSRANSFSSKREEEEGKQNRRSLNGTNDQNPNNGDDNNNNANKQKWYKKWLKVCKRHSAFVGPGIITCVGYTDPGNWVTDLAAGSQFGYKLLFIVLVSGLFGIFLQILAVRMGVVTGNDLARNTRMLLLPDDQGKLSWFKKKNDDDHHTTNQTDKVRFRNARILTLWGLYLVSEGALIATELAELLGSAIALNLLFPGLPLYGGVIVTCADVMLFLFVYKPQGNFRIFELLIASLVMVVLACYIALLVRTKPNWTQVFDGYVPSSTLVQPQALYTGIGIIGAVIMPHAMYLGSHFSTINRIDRSKNALRFEMDPEISESLPIDNKPWFQRFSYKLRLYIANTFSSLDAHLRHKGNRSPEMGGTGRSLPAFSTEEQEINDKKEISWPNRMSIDEMKIHLPHAAWDIGLSLFFFAITINSAILIVAGAAFYYGNDQNPELGDLYDAFNLLKNTLGHVYAILFAIALLAAGQSASITCTLAGQLVSEGFIKWRTNAFLRRMITRIITAIPALAIAIGIGRNGLDEMLIASQVVLSFALPFVLVPLILVTSMKSKMCIEDEVDQEVGIERKTKENKGKEKEIQTNSNLNITSTDAIVLETPITETITETTVLNPKSSCTTTTKQDNDQTSSSSSSTKIVSNFTNHWSVIIISLIIFFIIVIADIYTLVTLFLGEQ